ncbi:uncharacterized protein F4812DRAFT_468226 [Daldinia caldariorum]|uniref:uncharacterized protein n=1 Tax=Daldinia caldariorum TaxID=326644 RepID=UPI002007D485|nr:uncharacterized protein F4812DRAFT_468226 [Daldinia caldariorum]KAI1464074.1 hypothetical protein F4812DRAFT_468226 [Daldinia caldariorum]
MSENNVRPGLARLPTELVIEIFSDLPDIESMQNFALASKNYQDILTANQCVIARRFATRTTKDTDAGVVRLAFLTCKARDFRYFYNGYGDEEGPYDGGLDFLEKYGQRGDWPSRYYQVHALTLLPRLSNEVEIVLGWVIEFMAPLPPGLEDEGFTCTELSRQRRLLYMIDFISTCLAKSKVPQGNNPASAVFFNALWDSFSQVEVFLMYELLSRVVQFLGTRLDLIVWPGAKVLVRSIFVLWGYKQHLEAFIVATREELSTSENRALRIPLTDDPEAFVKDKLPADPEEEGHLMGFYYYSPLQYDSLTKGYLHLRGLHYWFFLIGDKDRCESVLKRGPVWTWETGTNALQALLGDPVVVWQQDPALFNCPGKIGTKVPYYELCNERS